MGISLIGQGVSAATVRYVVATFLVLLALFTYLYGPAVTAKMSEAAQRECVEMTGSTYRNYRLEWRTTTLTSVSVPHWVCHDLTERGRPGTSLGWWVDL